MDNLLAALEELTVRCASSAEQMDYLDIERFVEERGRILASIQATPVPDKSRYQEQVERILRYDPIILARMEQLKQEAADALGKRSDARRQKSAYEVDYTPDAVLFDRRK
ncbi:hypothetical protein J31TS4_42730 [Paenibacillus sp. J31TS4]|uniref:flagellar protein FliT n=1 Tax=Paenibacillus sp. J31TS4 TaxID=2807195 RepID=UPI001B1EB859|nr:flagellar protein FliT [Paenibacillus sp. J31TS4]GIP40993.1 hypothetical protein J31TS4_42730 [Paenibacillus sp. J31TS4]